MRERETMKEIRYILASGSPRRREILDRIGISYEVILPEVLEEIDEPSPDRIVQQLSARKAETVAEQFVRPAMKKGTAGSIASIDGAESAAAEDLRMRTVIVIAADTLVAYGDEVLGKPKDREDAVRMIRLLAGKTHHVYTGVTLIRIDGDRRSRDTFCESAAVRVRPMTEEEIRDYVATGEPDDKAGSYAIQGIFGRYIEGYDGDFETIKGLPGDAVSRHIEALLELTAEPL